MNMPNTPSAAWVIPGLKRVIPLQIDRTYEPRAIVEAVCWYFGVKEELLKKRTRKREIANARQTCCYLLCTYTPMTLKNVGRMFGDLDHTTAMHARNKIEGLLCAKIWNQTQFDVPQIIKNIQWRTVGNQRND